MHEFSVHGSHHAAVRAVVPARAILIIRDSIIVGSAMGEPAVSDQWANVSARARERLGFRVFLLWLPHILKTARACSCFTFCYLLILLGYAEKRNDSILVVAKCEAKCIMGYMLNTKHTETALSLMPAMRGMFAKMGLRQDQIEDASQDGFVFLVTYALPKWEGKGSIYTFALTSVKRRWIDSARLHDNRGSKRAFFPSENSEWGTDLSEYIADNGASDRAENSLWLAAAVECLSNADLRILAAVARNGSWRDAAGELGISTATASRAKARIRAVMVDLIERDNDED